MCARYATPACVLQACKALHAAARLPLLEGRRHRDALEQRRAGWYRLKRHHSAAAVRERTHGDGADSRFVDSIAEDRVANIAAESPPKRGWSAASCPLPL